jgi:hypothetical protein
MTTQELNIMGTPVVDEGPGTGPVILGVSWTFASLGIIAVGLRMWARRPAGYDLGDWLMVLATALMIIYQAVLTESVVWGLGRTFESITLDDYHEIFYWQLLAQFFLNLQPVFSRWSIAVFLIRLFGEVHQLYRYFLIFWVAFMAFGAILANILTLTLFDPIEANWDPVIEFRHRFPPIAVYYTAVGCVWQQAISDLAFSIIPVYFVWQLHMPTHRKLGLIGLLGGSVIAFLASLGKIIFSTMQIRGETASADGPTTLGVIWITAGVEQGLVVLLGSLPSLGPLAHMHLVNSFYDSLVFLVTLGRRSRESVAAPLGSYHDDEIELGPKQSLNDGGSGRPQFVDGTHASTVDGETAKYVKRTDDFLLVKKGTLGKLS